MRGKKQSEKREERVIKKQGLISQLSSPNTRSYSIKCLSLKQMKESEKEEFNILWILRLINYYAALFS